MLDAGPQGKLAACEGSLQIRRTSTIVTYHTMVDVLVGNTACAADDVWAQLVHVQGQR